MRKHAPWSMPPGTMAAVALTPRRITVMVCQSGGWAMPCAATRAAAGACRAKWAACSHRKPKCPMHSPRISSDGDQVVAGTVATDSGLRIQVTAVGDDTALAGIGRLVADAQNSTSRAQRIADTAAVANARMFIGFTPGIVGTANVEPSSLINIIGVGCDAGCGAGCSTG